MENCFADRTFFGGLLIAIGLTISSLCQASPAETLYENGKISWNQGDFQSAYNLLMEYRKKPYGRRPEVDYMLGTSGCRLTGMCGWGARVLDWMLYAYPLTATSRSLVIEERDRCRASAAPLVAASAPPAEIEDEISAGMSARGKTFYWVDREVPVNSYPARRVRKLEHGEFRSRLTELGRGKVAREKVKVLVPDFQVADFERFVIATGSNQKAQELEDISETMDTFLAFLVHNYRFTPFTEYITIYLVPSVGDLRSIARRVHGLDVSPATIGYAFREDLSVVAVIPGKKIGTLFHEIFHLTVRKDFGDIPQWLDEGMASLYEVSRKDGALFRGEANWRGKVLDQLWDLRPSLSAMISSSWFAFDLPEEYSDPTADGASVQRQAAHMAMARYFALYLQEKKMLQDVFFSYRNNSISDVGKDAEEHVVKIMEETLGSPIAAVQGDFEDWYGHVQGLGRIPR